MERKKETILSLNKKIKILKEVILTLMILYGSLSSEQYNTIKKKLEEI